MQRSLWIRFATFLVWLLAAGCVVYWALKFVSGPTAPSSASVAAPNSAAGSVDAQALAKGLGGALAPQSASPTAAAAPSALQASRFVLTGVVVQKSSRQGVALIAVDGKPPRPYRVGAVLADSVILHSVSSGKAMLSTAQDAAIALTLELPKLSTALVGNAVAARPALPATLPNPVFAQPAAAPLTPSPSATMQATPTPGQSAAGQRPPRPLANRLREGSQEAARDQAGAPTQ